MELQPIQSKIYEIRGQRVMLDFDLAELYQVETRVLKQAVRRNIERFPEDFMLRLSAKEANRLIDIGRSQNVIPQGYNIGSSEMFAFTEEGVAMLSGVLRSKAAVQVNIAIMRAFVAMRNYITTTTTVTAELSEIRARLALLEQTGHVTFEQIRPSLCEGELFEHADGTLYCLFRNSSTPYDGYLWQAQSYDGGRNWTMPVRSDFSDNNTKSFFCALPDGRYLYIGTPDNTRQGTRYPLVLALSEDGFNYDKCYILSDDRYTRQYEGRWKSGDYGYPFAYIREGWIYVIVSRQKERMDALKCKISDLR